VGVYVSIFWGFWGKLSITLVSRGLQRETVWGIAGALLGRCWGNLGIIIDFLGQSMMPLKKSCIEAPLMTLKQKNLHVRQT